MTKLKDGKDSIAMTSRQPGFDAAVRVARRALAERIAASTREGRKSTGDANVPPPISGNRLPSIPSK